MSAVQSFSVAFAVAMFARAILSLWRYGRAVTHCGRAVDAMVVGAADFYERSAVADEWGKRCNELSDEHRTRMAGMWASVGVLFAVGLFA